MNIQIIPITQVSFGDRQRSDTPEDHISELAQDIQENGLIHAITLAESNRLVAGFCRLNAIGRLGKEYYYAGKPVPAGHVPVVYTHLVDEGALFRLELSENLRRKNLSPMDEARAIAKLHKLLSANTPGWTRADTGQEIDRTRGVEPRTPQAAREEVGDSLLLDSFANDPDVAKAKTRSEAVKIAKKKLQSEFTASLGALAGIVDTPHKFYEGDCREILTTLPDASVSCIITDPPYGMGADTFGEQTHSMGHQYEDTVELAISIATAVFKEGARVCKPDAHAYLFCDPRRFAELQELARAHGWTPWATPLIWHKPGLGHAPQPGFFGRRYEMILFAQRGNRKLSKSASDVFEFPALKDKLHAAQKPAELYAVLASLSAFPGEVLLDPCAGAGTIFRAAKLGGYNAVGIEADALYANICRSVIAEG